MVYKNLTSQEEADALKDFERAGLGRLKDELNQNFFTKIANNVTELFINEIEESTGDTSGTLKQSIVAIPSPKGFDIEGTFYYKFIDEGVNAAPKVSGLNYVKNRVSGAPFGFKNLGVGRNFARSIRESYSYSMNDAYGVAKGIKKYGIEPKGITEKVITDDLLEEISEDVSTLLGLAVEVTFDKATDTE